MLGLASLVLAAGVQLPRHAVFGAALSDTPQGAAVTRVIPQSSAAASGVSRSDVLISIGGVRTPTVAAFLAQMHRYHAGDRTGITLVHDKSMRTITVVFGSPADEREPGLTTEYAAVKVDGTLRRTLITYPSDASGKLPAVLLMGGIGCYTIDAAANPQDAYMRLTHDISRAGFVTMRLEKSGVGDSQGPPCASTDLAAEERSYAAALQALRTDPHVDPSRVFLLGHSIGSLEAPRLAAAQPVAGIVVAEAVGRAWPEYEIRNLRRQLELSGESPAKTDLALIEKAQCMVRLLYEKQAERSIEASLPACKTANAVYPVDPPYMQQIAAINIIQAWTKINVPVLAVYGSSDFVTEREDHERIVATVNARHPASAVFEAIAGMDHLLFTAPTPQASMQLSSSSASRTYDTELSRVVVNWLHRTVAAARRPIVRLAHAVRSPMGTKSVC